MKRTFAPMAMQTFDDFAGELREALTHLYDPAYQPPQDFAAILAAAQPLPPGSAQQMVIAAIQRLRPGEEVPATARSRRLYELLSCRYIQELTQEETAERLGITPRHLRREQQQAVHMLGKWLWTHRPALRTEAIEPTAPLPESGVDEIDAEWRLQVHQELAVLEASDPGVIADVRAVVEQVVRSESAGAVRRQARLLVAPGESGAEAAIHPSVLRQILIVAIQKLAQVTLQGQVEIAVEADAAHIDLTLTGAPLPSGVTVVSQFIAEAVASRGGQWQVERQGDALQLRIRLPRAQPVTLLVVDDNTDIVHVYRRYLERTRFRVVHVASGQAVLEHVAAEPPDVVLLDVMLPDMDGWEVLTHLHENLETRAIPVIICSVVRQEELALALGAARYLPKPVRRPDLVRALEQVLAPSSGADRSALANRATAY